MHATLALATCSLSSTMEVFGTVSAAMGLVATVLHTAKRIRDIIRLVSLVALIPEHFTILTRRGSLQAISEDEEIADLLEENKAEVDFLIETYNTHKEILDQHKLTKDLEQLLTYVPATAPVSGHHLTASIQDGGQVAQFSRRVQGRDT